ncbi:DotU family type IV/VI secretion system protein [Fluviispira vulneris]|uniref:DotU family type IV/VI secretion system protein n=1 Tax=Fluviispira vulneris TaxID=2763012 RepID=UPI00164914C4|nr:DotU family type IV/VI secretion system protein [Fluviispira vulneris]
MIILNNYECPILFTQECIFKIQNLLSNIDAAIENKNNLAEKNEEQLLSFDDENITKISNDLIEYIGNKIDTLKKNKNFDNSVLKSLQYMLIAFIDEKFITKNWPGRIYWQNESLEKKVFQSRLAGDVFFENCKNIIANRDYKYRELSYCYYLCLSSGFRGKYHSYESQFEIDQIKTLLYQFYSENKIDIKYNIDGVIPQSSLLIKSNIDENTKQRKISYSFLLVNFILITIFLIGSCYIWFSNTGFIAKSINILTNF